eukprot:6192832-Pleurochrysis_carterae.AAC.2
MQVAWILVAFCVLISSEVELTGKRFYSCSTVSNVSPLVSTPRRSMFEGSNASSDGTNQSESCDGIWEVFSECSEQESLECDDGMAGPSDTVAVDQHRAVHAEESGKVTGRGLGPAPSRIGKTTGVTDSRGGHSRENTLKRLTHEQYAYEHWLMASENLIGRPCLDNCPYGRKCNLNFTPRQLIRAHEYAFGSGTKLVVEEDGTRTYSCEKPSKECMQQYKKLAMEAVTYETDEKQTRVVRLTVDRTGPVCQTFWAKAYGISQCTSNRLLADARAGRLHADRMWSEAGEHGNLNVEGDDAPSSVAKEVPALVYPLAIC